MEKETGLIKINKRKPSKPRLFTLGIKRNVATIETDEGHRHRHTLIIKTLKGQTELTFLDMPSGIRGYFPASKSRIFSLVLMDAIDCINNPKPKDFIEAFAYFDTLKGYREYRSACATRKKLNKIGLTDDLIERLSDKYRKYRYRIQVRL